MSLFPEERKMTPSGGQESCHKFSNNSGFYLTTIVLLEFLLQLSMTIISRYLTVPGNGIFLWPTWLHWVCLRQVEDYDFGSVNPKLNDVIRAYLCILVGVWTLVMLRTMMTLRAQIKRFERKILLARKNSSCYIFGNELGVFYPCPKNLPEDKLRNFGIISLDFQKICQKA